MVDDVASRPVILFDFDGTLADTIPLIIESYQHTLAGAGLPAVDEPVIRSWIGRALLPVLEENYPGRSAELGAAYRTWNLAHHDELIKAVPGVDGLLRQLAAGGRRFGIVSSKKTETVRQGLRIVALDGLIDVAAGMDDTTEHKPAPAPLLFGARALGAASSSCVYVGDAAVDVLAAHAAGMPCVAVTWGAGTREALAAAGADAIVDDVAGLADALGTQNTETPSGAPEGVH